MLQTIIDGMREIIGTPEFYKRMTESTNYTWDYGAMFEYFFAGTLLCITVCGVFRFINNLVKK